MNLSCSQVSSLLPFYSDNKLNKVLMALVTKHLQDCPKCREKYETLTKIFSGLSEAKNYIDKLDNSKFIPQNDLNEEKEQEVSQKDYVLVQNLSAYIDNELSDEESLRIKKYVVTNLSARRTLEDIYSIKNLLQESFERTGMHLKDDFSKDILKQLNLQEELENEDPMVKVVSMLILISVLFIAGAVFVFWT